MHLAKLVLFILAGWAVARIGGAGHLDTTVWYGLVVAFLLATGLYASTYGIDLKEARQHFGLIVSAVTLGVIVKALIIGGSLAFIFQDPFFLVLGVVMAQIDPLSVASLMKGKRMSPKAKTILASWASFDDPITVILALYMPFLVMQVFGVDSGAVISTTGGLAVYLKELGLNLGLAVQAFCLYIVIRYYAKGITSWLSVGVSIAMYLLLVVVFSLSVFYFMMLGIALVGLFLRPPSVDRYIDRVVAWALRASALLLGLLLVGGINWVAGIALGIVAYCAQIVPGFLLTRKLPSKDRWHIAFAQQNGITAIVLALLFEPIHPGTVAIVAPAILVVNALHWFMIRLIDKKLS